ncbi:MAG: hypothetical protein ACLP01_07835 [Solirubrobacteraceae bacterium]
MRARAFQRQNPTRSLRLGHPAKLLCRAAEECVEESRDRFDERCDRSFGAAFGRRLYDLGGVFV